MEKFVNKFTKLDYFHIIQTKVRFGCIVQLIRNDPQMLYPLIKLFESKSCDLTIQVNFFCICLETSKNTYLKNHSWRLELKEGLILVDTQAFVKKKSVKILKIFLNALKVVFTQRYSNWNKRILSLLSIILLSFSLLKKYNLMKKLKPFNFCFRNVFYSNHNLNLVFTRNVYLLCITDSSGT